MSMGTFGSFNIARLGIYAAQKGITLTGHNIANINTDKFTRQKIDQAALHIGGADRYASINDKRTGQGVLVTNISQMRDPYLDIRYRTSSSTTGYMDVMLGGLEGIQKVLDETGKGEITEGKEFGVIAAQLEQVYKALNSLTDQTGHDEYDIQVRAACDALCKEIQAYARDLEKHYNNTMKAFEQDVSDVNTILTSIRDLNESIRNSDIHGDPALELRDERNRQIDRLSEFMKISVTYSMEEISPGHEVEKLTIRLDDANPDGTVDTDSSRLIDGIYGAQISIDPKMNPEYDPNRYLDANGDPTDDPDRADKDANGDLVVNPANKNPKYMKSDGHGGFSPTDELGEAAHNDLLNMTISELRDSREQLLYDVSKTKEQAIDETEYGDGKVKTETDKDGVITITTYRRRVFKGETHYYKTVYTKDPSKPVSLDDNDLYGALQADRELLTENGEFTQQGIVDGVDESAVGKRGIPYYQKSLDLLAKKFAEEFNKANRGCLTDPDGNYIKTKLDGDGKPVLDAYGNEIGEPLLTVKDQNIQQKDSKGRYLFQKTGSTNGKLYYKEGGKVYEEDGTLSALTDADLSPAYRQDQDEKGNLLFTDPNNNQVTLNKEDGKYYNADGTEYNGDVKDLQPDLKVDYHLNRNDSWDDVPQAAKDQLPGWDAVDNAGNPLYATVEEYLTSPKLDANGDPVLDANGKEVLNGQDLGAMFVGGNLFSNNGNSNDGTGINASNISISASWREGVMIVPSTTCPPGSNKPASTDSNNILENMTSLFYKKLDYNPQDLVEDAASKLMFTGTFEQMWVNMNTTLGNDMKVTNTLLDASYLTTVQLDASRDSVSAVDFNDEAMNLMMYSKSYNAACRFLTTLDSVIDKLVNGTGLTT